MWTIKQPSKALFGINSAKNFDFSDNCLVITSSGARKRGWLDYLDLKNFLLFDNVESNPSIETTEKIISMYSDYDISQIVGIGGGSSLDVAKFCAHKMNKFKILIPTTFGSGSEVTRISVLKVNGKKQSFHDDTLFADIAIIDPFFLENCDKNVKKNSIIDACAQCTEAYDSKLSNDYTKFLCEQAFELLEDGIFSENNNKIAMGSFMTGLGFGNSSTTLGHALSYVYSNEGFSHGHALAFTTTIAHQFNDSKFYKRFKRIVRHFGFEPISLSQDFSMAADIILSDHKHIGNNPLNVTKKDIVDLLTRLQGLRLN